MHAQTDRPKLNLYLIIYLSVEQNVEHTCAYAPCLLHEHDNRSECMIKCAVFLEQSVWSQDWGRKARD